MPALLLFLLVVGPAGFQMGCAAKDPKMIEKTADSEAALASDEEPAVAEGFPRSEEMEDMYSPTYGERVTFEALYVVAPVSGGKRLQATTLLRDDGDSWIRSYRPVPDEYRFVDRRVVVTGQPYENSPYVQSVGGTHFEVESIEFAPGETPVEANPELLPAPPFVRSAEVASGRGSRWGQCRGELVRIDPADEESRGGDWRSGLFRFEDGTELRVERIPGSDAAWTADPGRSVTLLTYYRQEADGVVGVANALCEGEVERCGIDEYPPADSRAK